MDDILRLLAYSMLILGLIGSFLPLLPGPLLIWGGVGIWAWIDGFQKVTWPTLGLLALVALLAWTSDLLLTTYFSRRAGVSWKSMGGALLGGVVGGIALAWIPLAGALLGAIGGALAGMMLVEYADKRDWTLARRAALAYLTGHVASVAVEAFLSMLMLAIFVWKAFL